MTQVLTLTRKQIDALKDYYRHALKKPPNPHMEMFIKEEKLTIAVYKSGKVVFQGPHSEEAFFFWHNAFGLPPLETKARDAEFFKVSIGSDESGVGDYFGPLTVASVYVDDTHRNLLKRLQVRDSKTMSDKDITEAAATLEKRLPHSVFVLDNIRYNDGIEKGYNANALKAYLHEKTHRELIGRLGKRPEIIIDKFCAPSFYRKHLEGKDAPIIPDVFVTGAETLYASVAAASILARNAYVEALKTLEKELGMTLEKGASKRVEKKAAAIAKTHGETILRRIAKLHFKTTQKALGQNA